MLDTPTISRYEGVSGVYLLAFYRNGVHAAYGMGRYGTASHYLGFSSDIGRRLAEHQHGQGARLTRAVCLAGWELRLARVWPGATRQDERRLKCSHNAARHCPLCLYSLAPIPTPAPAPVPLLALAAVFTL